MKKLCTIMLAVAFSLGVASFGYAQDKKMEEKKSETKMEKKADGKTEMKSEKKMEKKADGKMETKSEKKMEKKAGKKAANPCSAKAADEKKK